MEQTMNHWAIRDNTTGLLVMAAEHLDWTPDPALAIKYVTPEKARDSCFTLRAVHGLAGLAPVYIR